MYTIYNQSIIFAAEPSKIKSMDNVILRGDGQIIFARKTVENPVPEIAGQVVWGAGDSAPAGASVAVDENGRAASGFRMKYVPDGNGGWTEPDGYKEPASITVPIRDYIMFLLGADVYGTMKIARLGLQAKFQESTATEQDIAMLGALEAADGLIMMGETLNLKDPLVAQTLDIAVAIPAIPFTAEDKLRVLSNTPR